MDVPAPLDFVLGTTSITVRECARLAAESVVRLKQVAGADLELRLAGRAVATGEVVIADDNVSLRIGQILPPTTGDAA